MTSLSIFKSESLFVCSLLTNRVELRNRMILLHNGICGLEPICKNKSTNGIGYHCQLQSK